VEGSQGMTAYNDLLTFITKRMRMSHIYQPVMLKVLLENDGRATGRTIAKAFLNEDQSQIEYYENIVRDMPGRILSKHGIVESVDGCYRLANSFIGLNDDQRKILIEECDNKLNDYIEKRGLAPWQHRTKSSGHVPGSLRYDIFRRAKGRCEACGVSAEERALEVDHIIPRNKGGKDDQSNLQALCFRCNAQKRDRDDTDFTAVRESYQDRKVECPFCDLSNDRIISENELAVAIRDDYPVTEGHTLIIPRRHVSDYFDLYQPERNAIEQLALECRESLKASDKSIDGFNVGANSGASAGQTVDHVHLHLIPRSIGDMDNPRGGVRGVIPDKQDYQANGGTISRKLKGSSKIKKGKKVPLPHEKMLNVLLRAYEPCPNFGTCPEARWKPREGHIPRGYLGCTGELEEVEAVFVFAEPGHPQPGESYIETSSTSLVKQVIEASYKYKSKGIDLFHKNLLWIMNELWPELSFDECLRKVWMTESRLCSVENEIAEVKGGDIRLCTREFLIPQIEILPKATVVLFGGKARNRTDQCIPQALSAYALSPPGANHKPARPSWKNAIKEIKGRRRTT
jgi:ATP adenylyltransferase